ncbi:hypothetical protein B0H14DRAFT_3453301 [Mycena olivaceomarginata]|nr:hypothetical protein B0H14DRAFT_3453301 [Mycena olivaceomarginata]
MILCAVLLLSSFPLPSFPRYSSPTIPLYAPPPTHTNDEPTFALRLYSSESSLLSTSSTAATSSKPASSEQHLLCTTKHALHAQRPTPARLPSRPRTAPPDKDASGHDSAVRTALHTNGHRPPREQCARPGPHHTSLPVPPPPRPAHLPCSSTSSSKVQAMRTYTTPTPRAESPQGRQGQPHGGDATTTRPPTIDTRALQRLQSHRRTRNRPHRVSHVATVLHHRHPLLSSLPPLFRFSNHITDKDSPPKRRLPLPIPQPPKRIIEHAGRAREADQAEGEPVGREGKCTQSLVITSLHSGPKEHHRTRVLWRSSQSKALGLTSLLYAHAAITRSE